MLRTELLEQIHEVGAMCKRVHCETPFICMLPEGHDGPHTAYGVPDSDGDLPLIESWPNMKGLN